MAIFRNIEGKEIRIIDGIEFALDKAARIDSVNLMESDRYARSYKMVIAYKEGSILTMETPIVKDFLILTRRHVMLGVPIYLRFKTYQYEPGKYTITHNKHGRLRMEKIGELE